MSLDVALQYAVSGLTATQAQLQVISGNIANAQTPGYSDETLPQTSRSSATTAAPAVVTGEVQRATDKILQAAHARPDDAVGRRLDAQQLFAAAPEPARPGRQRHHASPTRSTISSARCRRWRPRRRIRSRSKPPSTPASSSPNSSTACRAASRRCARTPTAQIATDVGTVNTALNSIAQLNGQISQLQALGQSTATLQDQRDQALAQVAQYVGVQSYTRPDGTLVVLTTQGPVAGRRHHAPAVRLHAVRHGHRHARRCRRSRSTAPNVTSQTTTGEIGALLQLRDTALPNVTAQLNQFTNSLFNLTATPDLQTTNSGLGATNDANDFFAAVNTARRRRQRRDDPGQSRPRRQSGAARHRRRRARPEHRRDAFDQPPGRRRVSPLPAGSPAITTTLGTYIGQIIGAAATHGRRRRRANANGPDRAPDADAGPVLERDRRQSRFRAQHAHRLPERLWRVGAGHLDDPEHVRRADEHARSRAMPISSLARSQQIDPEPVAAANPGQHARAADLDRARRARPMPASRRRRRSSSTSPRRSRSSRAISTPSTRSTRTLQTMSLATSTIATLVQQFASPARDQRLQPDRRDHSEPGAGAAGRGRQLSQHRRRRGLSCSRAATPRRRPSTPSGLPNPGDLTTPVNGAPPNGYYQGNNSVAQAQVDNDLTLQYGVTADNPAFEQVVRVLNFLANSPPLCPTNPTDVANVNQAQQMLTTATTSLQQLTSNIGLQPVAAQHHASGAPERAHATSSPTSATSRTPIPPP